MEKEMAKKTKSKLEELEAKNRVIDLEKLVIKNTDAIKHEAKPNQHPANPSEWEKVLTWAAFKNAMI